MKKIALSAGEVLDDAGELASSLSPWVAFAWLSGLPLRLAQAHFAARLLELSGEARAYGDHLRWLALLTGVSFLVACCGRAVFVSACRRRLQGVSALGLSPLRLPIPGLLTYLYVALALEAVFYASCLSGVVVPAVVLLAGLAAATVPFEERPGLLRPFAQLGASAGHVAPLLLVLLAFGAAFLLAAVNLLALSQAGLWLVRGVAGLDAGRWNALLSPGHPRFLCVLLACGWLLVEPWWIAAMCVYVHKLRARSTGEDLRLWFERLRGASA